MESQPLNVCVSSTLLSIAIVWLTLAGSSCESNCPLIQGFDLGSTDDSPSAAGLIGATFSSAENVQIMNYKIVCLAQGTVRDAYRFVSIVVNYTYNGTERLSQFQFECQSGNWSANLSGSLLYARTDPPDASLETILRKDCVQCVDPSQLSSANNSQHCVACNESCSEGLMRCSSENSCCNYFNSDNECLSVCPNNSLPTNESQCVCIEGYEGVDCSKDIDECQSATPLCMNGGVCNNTMGSFTCICLPGFTGNLCQNDTNECNSDPCMNGGICTNTPGSFSCSCQSGFTGSVCQTEIDECASGPCINGGTCDNQNNTYTCFCAPGYTGMNCSENINECLTGPSVCMNGGTCIDTIGSYMCECASGYSGQACEQDINDCDPNPCNNGGYCTDGVSGFSCNCTEGWSGNVCDECTLQACLNCRPEVNQGSRAVCEMCDNGYTLLTPGRICSLQASSLGTGAISGIVVACLIGILLMILLVVLMVAILCLLKKNRIRYSSAYRMAQVQADKESSVHVMKNPVYFAPDSVEPVAVDSGVSIEADEHLAVNKAALEFEEITEED